MDQQARHDCMAGAPSETMTLDAAQLRALAAARPPEDVEWCALDAALGRIAASPTPGRVALPPFDNSAMDGYALCTDDLGGPGPWRLRVAGRIAAGDTAFRSLTPGTAARIFTGAPIPSGADAVVLQEHVARHGDWVELAQAPAAGANIRRSGEDCAEGAAPVGRGQTLTPARLALLAAQGVEGVAVFRRLRVAMFSTGDELREPGQALSYGQIYNSNRVMLRAMLTRPWVEIADYGILKDCPETIRATIRRAAAEADVVISSGGVSAGEEDHILDALRRANAELDILKVAIRPGKPLTVGRIGGALYFGLPGNPYATAVTFSQIAMPALRKAAGLAEAPDDWLPGVADFDYSRRTGRVEFVPVTWTARDPVGRPCLQRLGRGASASLGPMAGAHGLAEIPADCARVTPGMALRIMPLPH